MISVIRSIRYHRRRIRSGTDRWRELETQLGYFRRNQDKMDYAHYRAQGFPIGSGPVEAACKNLVGTRLKRSGMAWSREGGQRVLNIRALILSRRWDLGWSTYRSSRAA